MTAKEVARRLDVISATLSRRPKVPCFEYDAIRSMEQTVADLRGIADVIERQLDNTRQEIADCSLS